MNEQAIIGPRIELVGNRRVIIDGCDGIIDYGEDMVKARLGRLTVQINGRSLKLKVLTDTKAIVEGYISSLEYHNERG